MNTFFVCLRFVSMIENGNRSESLYEDSIRLIHAANSNEAAAKATDLGKVEEHSYLNDEGKKVSWTFERLIDVQEFCEVSLSDGVEVYSRLHRVSAADSLA